MTAYITAGGRASEIIPTDIPMKKGMLKICGRTLISYAADMAAAAGADTFIAGDTADEAALRECTAGEISKVSFCGEENIKFPSQEDILFIRGDMLCGADIGRLMKSHRSSGSDVTVLCVSGKGSIIGNRKHLPYRGLEDENAVFSGIMAVRPEAAGRIFSGISFSDADADDILRVVLECPGLKISQEIQDIFLACINSPSELIAAQKAVMYGRYVPAGKFAENEFSPDLSAFEGISCDTPVKIGSGCIICGGASVSAGSSVGDCVYIGRNAVIDGSIIMNGAYIGENTEVRGAVVCENARLLSGSRVMHGASVGRNACIGENSAVFENVRVHSSAEIPGETAVTSDVMYNGSSGHMMFDSDGRMCGETNGSVTPAAAAAMGSAAAGRAGRICICHSGSNASEALAAAFAAGVSAAGGTAVCIGEASRPELLYAVRISGCGCGCGIDSAAETEVFLCAGDGLPMDEDDRKYIENAFSSGEYRRVGYSHFGEISSSGGVRRLYRSHLSALLEAPMSGVGGRPKVRLTCPDKNIYELCSAVLDEKKCCFRDGDDPSESIVFNISGDGSRVSAYTEETGYVFHDKLVMLCILRRMKYSSGETSVSSKIPAAADRIAERFHKKLRRYSAFPDHKKMSPEELNEDISARKAAAATPFAEDGCAVMFTVLDLLVKEAASLAEALKAVPGYACAGRFVPMKGRSSEIFRRLCSTGSGCEGTPDGISSGRGRVTIRPVRTGSGIMIYAESYSAEMAAELCGICEDIITREYRKK